ncbi:MAG: very short patch repair endonuclease [Anaerolineaceae bacterium]|nr:very short patch repair endonuclease [Anaerolineaceae bacterium]
MPDNLSPEDRIRTMRSVKSQKTSPERRLRGMLTGLRVKGWKVNPKEIIGKPDFAFPDLKVAIFVDGCFWHGCPTCQRPLPETNREYWVKKIENNKLRDKHNTLVLESADWIVLRIWEHQLKRKSNLLIITQEIRRVLEIKVISSSENKLEPR